MATTAQLVATARADAVKYGINPDYFVRQIYAESGFRPTLAPNSAGAGGIAQFTPGTGAKYGLKTPADIQNPVKALDAAARHMRDNVKAANGSYAGALEIYISGHLGGGGSDARAYKGRILNGKNPDGTNWSTPAWLKATGGAAGIGLTAGSDAGTNGPGLVNDIGNAVGDVAGGAADVAAAPVKLVAGAIAPVGHFFANLVEPAFWLRVGKVLLGILLLAFALRRLA